MKIIAVIPARYASTRFPAKLMQDLGGKTVILRTYEAAISTNLFDDVFVVTDSVLIYNEIISNGGKAIMSIKEHESGSDRIAEAVEHMDVDVVINVQGDEPFINKKPLEELIEVFKNDLEKKVDLGSLMFQITDKEEINNPNNVKVITDQQGFALYLTPLVGIGISAPLHGLPCVCWLHILHCVCWCLAVFDFLALYFAKKLCPCFERNQLCV